MPALAPDPFARLTPEEALAAPIEMPFGTMQPAPIIPVPDGAPPAEFHHGTFGDASSSWAYRDGAGRLLSHVARFDTPTGKQILPRSWCRLADGRHGWRWRAFSAPRPLYGLERLAARLDAQVLVVEGEKTADAARSLFVDQVLVTWPGGANAAASADWGPMAGRSVIIWPDADAPGQRAATEVARLATKAGAVSVTVVPVPDHLPEGWDLADPTPEDIDLHALLAAARKAGPETELPYGYIMTAKGLVWCDPEGEKPDLVLAGPFQVLAETRDGEGNSWGVLLEWHDNDHRRHRFPFPRAMLGRSRIRSTPPHQIIGVMRSAAGLDQLSTPQAGQRFWGLHSRGLSSSMPTRPESHTAAHPIGPHSDRQPELSAHPRANRNWI